MSVEGSASPTKGSSPEEIVKMYEEMFKHRYTEDDEDYKKTVSKPLSPPPCLSKWFTKSRRNDWGRDDRPREWGGHHWSHGYHGQRGNFDHHRRGHHRGYRSGQYRDYGQYSGNYGNRYDDPRSHR